MKPDFKQFFSTQRWWGKILGAFFGYLMAGPVGALFGILVGNAFDLGLSSHFAKPHWHFHNENHKETQKVFFSTTFSVLGYIAKADGRVSEGEIDMARQMMSELQLSKAQRRIAIEFFTEGKQPDFNLQKAITRLLQACHHKRNLLKVFADIQYRAAHVDGLNPKKIEALDLIFGFLGFAALHKQYRFHQDHGHSNYHQSSSSSNHSYQGSQTQYQQPQETPYDILEISRQATKSELKRAYRRLMSQNHPDKLIAQGLPDEMIKIATDKTQKIQKAYETIKQEKGF